MKRLSILYNLLRLAFLRCILSVLPIATHAGLFPEDKPTEEYCNWAYCLAYQSYHRWQHKLGDNIEDYRSKWGKWVTFPNKIAAIALKVGAWEKPEALFASQDFISMYKHPAYYWKHAIDYLANPIYSEKHKKIAIYGLENLGCADYLSFAERCYKLYQANQLSEPLFQMVIGFEFLHIHPLVMGSIAKGHHKDSNIKAFLKKVDSEVEKDSLIKPFITEIVSGRLGNAWAKKGKNVCLHYKDPLPFPDIIHKAYKDANIVLRKDLGFEYYSCDAYQPPCYEPPYFLMIYDHPSYYSSSNAGFSRDNAAHHGHYLQPVGYMETFLTDPNYSVAEKRLAIFAMQQLDSHAYARLVERICLLYNWHPSLLYIMQDLIHCNIQDLFHKYPFFILDHKDKKVQQALDKLLGIPSLTCRLQFMTKKLKRGSLATPDETNRIQCEATLHKTRFRLYETIGTLRSPTH